MRGLKEDERRGLWLSSHQVVTKEFSMRTLGKRNLTEYYENTKSIVFYESILNMTNSLKSRCFLKLSSLKSELMGRFNSGWWRKELEEEEHRQEIAEAICRLVRCNFDKQTCVCYPVERIMNRRESEEESEKKNISIRKFHVAVFGFGALIVLRLLYPPELLGDNLELPYKIAGLYFLYKLISYLVEIIINHYRGSRRFNNSND